MFKNQNYLIHGVPENLGILKRYIFCNISSSQDMKIRIGCLLNKKSSCVKLTLFGQIFSIKIKEVHEAINLSLSSTHGTFKSRRLIAD